MLHRQIRNFAAKLFRNELLFSNRWSDLGERLKKSVNPALIL